MYVIASSSIGDLWNMAPMRIAFWTTGILFKIVPCILLTIFLITLVIQLLQAKRRQKRLRRESTNSGSSHGPADRVTTMLLAVLVVFLIVQLPQGTLTVLVGFKNKNFRRYVYNNLGEILELTSLISSSVNFILYCCMNSEFRRAFEETFCCWNERCSRQRKKSNLDNNTIVCESYVEQHYNSITTKNITRLNNLRNLNQEEMTELLTKDIGPFDCSSLWDNSHWGLKLELSWRSMLFIYMFYSPLISWFSKASHSPLLFKSFRFCIIYYVLLWNKFIHLQQMDLGSSVQAK